MPYDDPHDRPRCGRCGSSLPSHQAVCYCGGESVIWQQARPARRQLEDIAEARAAQENPVRAAQEARAEEMRVREERFAALMDELRARYEP